MDRSSLTPALFALPQVLEPLYTSSRPPLYRSGAPRATLRCTKHPDWEVDIDGTDLPTVVEQALDHLDIEHA